MTDTDSAATGAGDELIAYLSDPPHGGNRYIGSSYSVEQMKKAADALRAKDAEIERLMKALTYTLEAINTGRSEPLFVARDLIVNTLDDLAALKEQDHD